MAKDWKEIQDDTKEKYALYLCSREWAEKRRAVHERAGGVCERCRKNSIDAVHHLTYARKYAELPEDLQGICSGCHLFTHGRSDIDPLDQAPSTCNVSWAIADVSCKQLDSAETFRECLDFSNQGRAICVLPVESGCRELCLALSRDGPSAAMDVHVTLQFTETQWEDLKRLINSR